MRSSLLNLQGSKPRLWKGGVRRGGGGWESKTKQRASMGPTLLDILMRIGLNGPEIHETFKVTELLGEAMQHFKAIKNRVPARASSGARSKRSTKGPAIGQLRSWKCMIDARDNDGLDRLEDDEATEIHGVVLPDVEVRTEEEEEEEEREIQQEQDALDAIPAFTAPDGWEVLDALPDGITFPGAPNMCSETHKYLSKKQVACKNVRVDGGWERGQVHMQEKSKQNMGLFSIKVPKVSGWVLYDLNSDTYKSRWVILKKK